MIVLFCDNGFNPREIDYMYAAEYKAAQQQHLQVALISFEELTKRNNATKSISRVKTFAEPVAGIYRGWMLRPADYENLYHSLLSKNIKLINTPNEYAFCHYLPNAYETIKGKTPKSVWLDLSKGYEDKDLIAKASVFQHKPIIVKDYVKSQKHYWHEACFIPNADDPKNVLKITKKFLELQDTDLNVGIVYREYIEFEPLTNHSISGMPLTKEFRVFVCNQQIVSIFKYWDEGIYNETMPNIAIFQSEIRHIRSNFYTMDIAKTKNGDWLIVELGDGQVAGLPDNADKGAFYRVLKDMI
jgi:ATP-grasp domain, R2K clade family 3